MFLIMNTIAQFFLVILTRYGHSLQTLWNTDNGNSDYVQKVSLIQVIALLEISQALAGFVPGLALTFIGYQPNVDQSAGTIFGLKVLFFAVWHVPSHSLSSLYGTYR